MQALKKAISYTHAGELFSKSLFLRETLSQEKSLLLITPSPEISKRYITLFQNLHISHKSFTSFQDYYDILSLQSTGIYVIDIESLCSYNTPQKRDTFELVKAAEYFLEDIIESLTRLGYEFHEFEKAGSYKKLGDTLHITSQQGVNIVLSFWGNELESIHYNGESIDSYILASLLPITSDSKNKNMLFDALIEQEDIFLILDTLEFHPRYEQLSQAASKPASFNILDSKDRKSYDLGVQSLILSEVNELRNLFLEGAAYIEIYSKYEKILREFFDHNSLSHVQINPLSHPQFHSFSFPLGNKTKYIICDDSISKIFIRKRLKKKLSAHIDELLKIMPGDYVVHIDHGIGLFSAIVKRDISGVEKEYLEIHYKEDGKLFVPLTELHRVSKYIGNENPELTSLSGKSWERKMQKVHEDVQIIAREILDSFAQRKLRGGKPLLILEEKIQEFQSSFPYPYTQDQAEAIEAITQDMTSEKNMDRLLVGDVGFGKTEVALNAALLAMSNKKQVLFLSPLVVLAHEHYQTAQKRFAGLGYRIEVLTRLQSNSHASRVLKELANGDIDLLIGTHRLLSDKTICKNLGLLIVDEEHKFGVVDKEKIKKLRNDIDILSLSATPIPRSLNLALSGVRDMSLLKHPPIGRKSIETLVSPYNPAILQSAMQREFERGGQVFFVHNRIGNISVIEKQIQELFPKKKIITAHGQLPGDELEDRIIAFKEKKYDILLSTTVIENGIDFSNVNTIFINECQSFGISQIHQLRGRVGRSERQGYCYLLYRKEVLDGDAAKRIQTIVDYSFLGAGFELAMKDLELRGGGDILGIRQSGQAQEIGMSLFLKMLEQRIEELKEEKNQCSGELSEEKKYTPATIELNIPLSIPESYFATQSDKIQFYREIELVETLEDLTQMRQAFEIQNADISREAENLFLLLESQIRARDYGIKTLRKLGQNYQIEMHEAVNLELVKKFLSQDTELHFEFVSIEKLRAPVKDFASEQKFVQYVLQVLRGTTKKMKIRKLSK